MAQEYERFKKPLIPSLMYAEDPNNNKFKALKIDTDGKLFTANRVLLDPISKANLKNQTVTDSSDILSSDLTPTYSPTIFRIYVAFDTRLRLDVVRNGSVEYLNSGINLNANSAYAFDIIVDEDEFINLRPFIDGTGTTTAVLIKLSIIELANMV